MEEKYLTYLEYTRYGGQLPVERFNLLEFRARKRIDYLTDCRVSAMAKVPEAVKLCMMQIIAVCDKFSAESQLQNPLIASYNTDGYSESYGSADSQIAAVNKALDASIREMLYGELDDKGTPLLYRGLDR